MDGRDFTESWLPGTEKVADNCFVHALGQFENQGCSQGGPSNSLGAGFNAQGGGTYASEWDPDAGYIRTWFWHKDQEPPDVKAGKPDPATWGTPYSLFSLDPQMCDPVHFRNMRIVFSLNFCGDLARTEWEQGCPDYAATMTCEEYVGSHPDMLKEAYWSISRFNIYQKAETWTGPVIATPSPPHVPALLLIPMRVTNIIEILRGFEVTSLPHELAAGTLPATVAAGLAVATFGFLASAVLVVTAGLRRRSRRTTVATSAGGEPLCPCPAESTLYAQLAPGAFAAGAGTTRAAPEAEELEGEGDVQAAVPVEV
jgi:hypothetical protein